MKIASVCLCTLSRLKAFLPTSRTYVLSGLGNNTSSAGFKQPTTFITFPCPARSSRRPRRNHATTGLHQEVPEATKSSLVGLNRKELGPQRSIVPVLPTQLTMLRVVSLQTTSRTNRLKTKFQG